MAWCYFTTCEGPAGFFGKCDLSNSTKISPNYHDHNRGTSFLGSGCWLSAAFSPHLWWSRGSSLKEMGVWLITKSMASKKTDKTVVIWGCVFTKCCHQCKQIYNNLCRTTDQHVNVLVPEDKDFGLSVCHAKLPHTWPRGALKTALKTLQFEQQVSSCLEYVGLVFPWMSMACL